MSIAANIELVIEANSLILSAFVVHSERGIIYTIYGDEIIDSFTITSIFDIQGLTKYLHKRKILIDDEYISSYRTK